MTGTRSYSVFYDTNIVFEMDNWKIQNTRDGTYAPLRLNSIIVHNCSKTDPPNRLRLQPLVVIETMHLSAPCMYCHEVAPDEIQTLWILQNMDLI